MFLSELLKANLPGAEVHHERAGWFDFGVNCPEVSHLTRFNMVGNLPQIRSFWAQKLKRDAAVEAEIYAEATHIHAKAGLIENLDLVPAGVRIVLIALSRAPLKVVWSLHNRFDFINYGFTWIFSLDPRYRNVIVDAKSMRRYGRVGSAIWYVIEMTTRAAYYRRLVADRADVTFHATTLEEIVTEDGASRLLEAVSGAAPAVVTLPPPANDMKGWHYDDEERQKIATVLDRINWNDDELAGAYFDAGRRLATPPWGPHGRD